MLSANDPDIRNRFFFAETAWETPSEDSTFKKRAFALCGLRFPSAALPDTAAIGETLAARFAGDWAAIHTVSTPSTAPLTMPTMLTPNTGISENSPPTRYRSTAFSPHARHVPSSTPIGTAVLHQFSASSRTKRTTCCLLMPTQRIMPKNCVRWAIVLFRLPEIISTPAISTSRNKIITSGYTFFTSVLSLSPASPMRIKFCWTSASARPHCSLISAIAFFMLAWLPNCT